MGGSCEPQYRFRKTQRLLASSQYQRVFDNVSIKAQGRFFTALGTQNDSNVPRLGLIVAKRNVRLAVRRNRLKRKIRESFRRATPELVQRQAFIDIIVLVKPAAVKAGKTQLDQDLEQLWSQLTKTAANTSSR